MEQMSVLRLFAGSVTGGITVTPGLSVDLNYYFTANNI